MKELTILKRLEGLLDRELAILGELGVLVSESLGGDLNLLELVAALLLELLGDGGIVSRGEGGSESSGGSSGGDDVKSVLQMGNGLIGVVSKGRGNA